MKTHARVGLFGTWYSTADRKELAIPHGVFFTWDEAQVAAEAFYDWARAHGGYVIGTIEIREVTPGRTPVSGMMT